jgi:hypothetical protein
LAAEWGLDLGTAGIRTATEAGTQLLGSANHGGSVVRVHREMVKDIMVGVEYWHAATNGAWVQGIDTDTRSDAGLVDLRYRHAWADWLAPFARCGLGVAKTTLEVSDYHSAYSAEQVAPLALASVGAELLIPRRVFARGIARADGFTLGLTWEVGYQHLFQRAWSAERQGGAPNGMSARPLELGDAAISGWLSRLAFVVRL